MPAFPAAIEATLETPGFAIRVSYLAEESERSCRRCVRSLVIADVPCEGGVVEPGPRLECRRQARRERQFDVAPLPALGQVPAHLPERSEPGGQRHEQLRLLMGGEPAQRGTEVVVLALEREPVDVGLGALIFLDPVGEREEVLGVSSPDLVGLAACLESLERVRADRLEHREARLAVGLLLLAEQAVVDQRRQARQEPVAAADRLGGLERAAADEDGEAREQRLLVGAEQLVAPVDRRAQRLLALGQVARAAGEELEAAARAGRAAPAARAASRARPPARSRAAGRRAGRRSRRSPARSRS